MNNNMIRKTLAVFSSVALTGAALVGIAAPAQAAGELKLEVNSGIGNAVPHTAEIVLKTSVTAGNDTSELQYLKYQIETVGGFEVHATSLDTASGSSSAGADLAHTATKAQVTTTTFTDGTDVVNYLNLYVEDSSSAAFAVTASTVRVTITAYVDKDADSLPDAGEWQASQEVVFMDADDISVTTVLAQPALADTTLTATVSSSNINISEAEDVLEVVFTDSNGAAVTGTDTSGAYDSDDNESTFSGVPDGSSVAAGTYSAKVEFEGTATALGNTSTRSVTAADIDGIALTVAAGNDNEGESGNDIDARSGSGSMTLVYTVTNGGTAVEDEVVTLKIEENAVNSLASAATVTAGGLSLTNTSASSKQKIQPTAISDADGEVTFVISWTGAVKTNKLDITASADGVTLADTITFEDAAVAAVYNLDVTGTTSSEIYVAKDAAFSLKYAMADQFGAVFTAANHTVQVSDTVITGTGVFSNGQATVNFGGYAALGAKTMTATVYKSAVTTSISTTTELTVGSPKAVATVTIAAGSGDSFGTAASREALMLKTWKDADVRLGQAAPTVANGNTVEATLRDSDGNVTQGAVTFSGAGLLFSSQSQVFSAGSITVHTNASGLATVEVYSNTSGTLPISVTSGGKSAAAKNFFFALPADNTATQITITAPATAAAGTTIQFTGVIADKYGNGVSADNDSGDDENFSVSYSGPGFAATAPTSAGSDGSFALNVLVGSLDSGTGTLTVRYDRNRDGDYTDSTDLVVTKSVVIGAAAVAATQKVNAGSFKGYVAVYARGYEGQRLSAKIGDDWVVVPSIVNNQENGTLFRVTDFTGAGVNISVRIFIDRVLIATIPLVTK